MQKGKKIRNLVESDNIATSLEEVILKATSLTPDLYDLEYGNKKTHLKKAKKKMRELKALVADLDKRIRGEVFEDVTLHAANNKHKYKGNAERFQPNE